MGRRNGEVVAVSGSNLGKQALYAWKDRGLYHWFRQDVQGGAGDQEFTEWDLLVMVKTLEETIESDAVLYVH